MDKTNRCARAAKCTQRTVDHEAAVAEAAEHVGVARPEARVRLYARPRVRRDVEAPDVVQRREAEHVETGRAADEEDAVVVERRGGASGARLRPGRGERAPRPRITIEHVTIPGHLSRLGGAAGHDHRMNRREPSRGGLWPTVADPSSVVW